MGGIPYILHTCSTYIVYSNLMHRYNQWKNVSYCNLFSADTSSPHQGDKIEGHIQLKIYNTVHDEGRMYIPE